MKVDNLLNIEDNILEEIRNKLSRGEINSFFLDNGYYFIVEFNQVKYIFSLLGPEYENITTLDLGDCEHKLKENPILKNNSLYMLSVEVIVDGMQVPKMEYEIYYKSHINKFEKLILDICQNININKVVPISIPNKDIDIYNSSSGFYNDVCYP